MSVPDHIGQAFLTAGGIEQSHGAPRVLHGVDFSLHADGHRITCARGTVIGLAGAPAGPGALIDAAVGNTSQPLCSIEVPLVP